MSEVVVADEIRALVPEARHDVVAGLVARTPYAAPVVASYSMDSLTLSATSAVVISNATG